VNTLADAYENGQRRRGQWAGELDFRGLVLAFRVNLRMHYVDTSDSGIRDRNAHRVDVFHVNDNHYVAGRRL
jgi:hypothetical protein